MQLLPHVRLAWLVHGITGDTIAEARAAHIDQLCPRANIMTAEAGAAALAAGLSVRGWGVKSLEVSLGLKPVFQGGGGVGRRVCMACNPTFGSW